MAPLPLQALVRRIPLLPLCLSNKSVLIKVNNDFLMFTSLPLQDFPMQQTGKPLRESKAPRFSWRALRRQLLGRLQGCRNAVPA